MTDKLTEFAQSIADNMQEIKALYEYDQDYTDFILLGRLAIISGNLRMLLCDYEKIRRLAPETDNEIDNAKYYSRQYIELATRLLENEVIRDEDLGGINDLLAHVEDSLAALRLKIEKVTGMH